MTMTTTAAPSSSSDKFLTTPPPQAYRPASASISVRKKEGFEPAVQRWSALLPAPEVVVGIYGVQSPAAKSAESAESAESDSLSSSALLSWVDSAITNPNGPSTVDHARFVDKQGHTHHVVTFYWVCPDRYSSFAADTSLESFWTSQDRLQDTVGVYREIMRVPTTHLESIYWPDYPGGLMKDELVRIYPTPYCGYYGAMRDRLGVAAEDDLVSEHGSLEGSVSVSASTSTSNSTNSTSHSANSTTNSTNSTSNSTNPTPNTTPDSTSTPRRTEHARWRIAPPNNMAVIRSAHTWGFMDAAQKEDYDAQLAPPLAKGMDFLQDHPVPAGCAELRWQTTCDAAGETQMEKHATAFFLDLGHMEAWAERHATHAAIFGAAIRRYRHYGEENQLRTWHEVYILPNDREQVFEYINCHPQTGLLPYFEAERLG